MRFLNSLLSNLLETGMFGTSFGERRPPTRRPPTHHTGIVNKHINKALIIFDNLHLVHLVPEEEEENENKVSKKN